jgi:hypothetical protein
MPQNPRCSCGAELERTAATPSIDCLECPAGCLKVSYRATENRKFYHCQQVWLHVRYIVGENFLEKAGNAEMLSQQYIDIYPTNNGMYRQCLRVPGQILAEDQDLSEVLTVEDLVEYLQTTKNLLLFK